MNNYIPTVNASGQFEAKEPFDQVVDPNTYYTVKAIRTITEMEGLKLNIYDMVFKKLGVTELEYVDIIKEAKDQGAIIATLIDRLGNYVYVLSTYFTGFPLTGGVSYEHMCLIVDLGPLPPSMKDVLEETKQHIQDYISANLGVDTETQLGTIPTPAYVSRDQYEAYERTRQNNVTDSTSDIAKIRTLEELLVKRDAYIEKLERIINP